MRSALADLERRAASASPTSYDPRSRTFTATIATDHPVKRRDYDGPFLEVLGMAAGTIRLDRLNAGASLLDGHAQWSMADRLGTIVPGSARLESGRLVASIRLGTGEQADRLAADLEAGHPLSLSVGYRIHSAERVEGEGDALPTVTATDWEPFEVSAVPVPADPNAVARSQPSDQLRARPASIGGQSVPDPIPDTLTDVPSGTRPTRQNERRLTLAERRDLAARHLGDEGRAASFAVDHSTLDDAAFRLRILDEMADASERDAVYPYAAPDWSASDQSERTAIVDALAHRLNPRNELPQAARRFAGASLTDIARHRLEASGTRVSSMGRGDIASRSLAHSSSDFPSILRDVMHKDLARQFALHTSALKRVARQETAQDFRAMHTLRLDHADFTLERVDELGEIKGGTLAESRESYAIDTFGRLFGISRKALTNDDLGAFADFTSMAARSAAEFESKFLTNLLESNPTMGDGLPLFHADHGNLAAVGNTLSVNTLSAARLAMRLQRGLGQNRVSVAPAFLVVGPHLETYAQQVLAEIDATKVEDANPFSGALELVVEGQMQDDSAWYLAASPDLIEGLCWAYLAGREGLHVESRQGFEVEGIEFKAVLDFGAGFKDYRGWYKNPGL